MAEPENLEVRTEDDVVRVRQAVRQRAREMRFGLVDQTKLVTAASELVRNTLEHGGGGVARIETVQNGTRSGIRVVFEDEGPGIGDVEQALTDGFSSRDGLGLGLGGARRLVDDFEIDSRPGGGTRVAIVRWS